MINYEMTIITSFLFAINAIHDGTIRREKIPKKYKSNTNIIHTPHNKYKYNTYTTHP